MTTEWIRVSKQNLCPICDHDHYCSVTSDGQVVHCMHLPSSKPCQSPKVGGWFHRLSDPIPPRPEPKPKVKPVPVEDFPALACKYHEAFVHIEAEAEKLGVSARSLERLLVGWNGNMTFPMRDANEQVIGIRIRGRDKKWCVTGSKQGLFWPDGINEADEWMILEGPTDTAAMLTLGFAAIGRPSCMGGVDMLLEILRRRRRDIIIMSDIDEAKIRPDGTIWYPGQEGAQALAEALFPASRTLRLISPPRHKDGRQWLKEGGATHDIVQTVINNTGYFV